MTPRINGPKTNPVPVHVSADDACIFITILPKPSMGVVVRIVAVPPTESDPREFPEVVWINPRVPPVTEMLHTILLAVSAPVFDNFAEIPKNPPFTLLIVILIEKRVTVILSKNSWPWVSTLVNRIVIILKI